VIIGSSQERLDLGLCAFERDAGPKPGENLEIGGEQGIQLAVIGRLDEQSTSAKRNANIRTGIDRQAVHASRKDTDHREDPAVQAYASPDCRTSAR